ncbi:MAG: competence/damage-inducible protein A [Actinomycetota bacterium]
MSKSVLICVGDELLAGVTVNTNAAMIGEMLIAAGLPVEWSACVSDEEDEIVRFLEMACAAAKVVIVTGGLGPTQDDKTREALARLLGTELERDDEIVEDIRKRFQAFGRTMPESNAQQGDIPKGASKISNPYGTAPGIRAEYNGAVMYAIPGVPGEARHMLTDQILPELAKRGDAGIIRARELRCVGVPESQLAEVFADLAVAPNPRMAFLPGGGEIKLRFVARGASEQECVTELDRVEAIVRERVGTIVYGTDMDTLEAVIGDELAHRGLTVATAESCTAGGLASRISNIPGSSKYFVGGIVAYTAEMKSELLDVPPFTIDDYGLVSEEVARGMAEGAQQRLRASYALAVTCAAGPDAHDGAEPGTICLGMAVPGGGLQSRKLRVPGDREQVRAFAATFALAMLRTHLLGE